MAAGQEQCPKLYPGLQQFLLPWPGSAASGPQGWSPGGKPPCAGPGWSSGSPVTEFLYPHLPGWGFRPEVVMAAAQGLTEGFAPSIIVRHILIQSAAGPCCAERGGG